MRRARFSFAEIIATYVPPQGRKRQDEALLPSFFTTCHSRTNMKKSAPFGGIAESLPRGGDIS
jgi:hypothetical protein